MPEIVYLNGAYVAPAEAKISIFDRGLLFADAVYEVAGVHGGKLLDFDSHMLRLERSLREMGTPAPLPRDEILAVFRELVRRERVEEGLVYMQITRGSGGAREFVPPDGLTPTVFAFAQHKSAAMKDGYRTGVTVASTPDIRWRRRDIKTVGLMGGVFAKIAAEAAGAYEALMHEDGYVTEGSGTSFYIVSDGAVITRPLSNDILHGCTRKALLGLVSEGGATLEERLFTLEEARAADEAFLTGASTYVTPVVQIDEATLGDGKPGPVTRRLQELYLEYALRMAV